MGLNQDAFNVLHADLAASRPDFVGRESILCPICLREISKRDVIERGVEHIVPQVAVKADALPVSGLGTKNQRCGITVLCRMPRTIKSTRTEAKEGCNGFKGSAYDWPFRHLLDNQIHRPEEVKHRHGVAILMMAYLAAFQTFGYDYILREELDPIREQFDFPDERITEWLEYAQYDLGGKSGIYAGETGLPFVFGGLMTADGILQVMFRRCQAMLPKGHWRSRGVGSLESLLRQG